MKENFLYTFKIIVEPNNYRDQIYEYKSYISIKYLKNLIIF